MIKLVSAGAGPLEGDSRYYSAPDMNVRSFIRSPMGVGPMATIAYLREIAGRCHSGKPLDETLAQWLGAALDQFLHRRSPTIEDAFGLRAPRGGVPWWLEEAIRCRDAALRELGDRHYARLSVAARARQIH